MFSLFLIRPPSWIDGPLPGSSSNVLWDAHCNPNLLERLASHLKDAATEVFCYKPGGVQESRYPHGLRVPIRFMPSLRTLHALDPSITLYEEYSEAETSILFPHREWRNLRALDGTSRHVLRL